MNKLKEYDIRLDELSEWVPYLALISPVVFLNKDDSLMSIISYTDCTDKSDKINEFLNKIPSGIACWIYRFPEENKQFCFVVWNTEYSLSVLTKQKETSIADFTLFMQSFLNSAKDFLPDVQLVKEKAALDVLSEIISFEKNIQMPNMTLYLDCYLTQNHTYTKKEQFLKVDDKYLNCIRILGYPNSYVNGILQFLEKNNIAYRYTRRIIFLDEIMKRKTQEKYFKNWCLSYRTFLRFLKVKSSEKTAYIDNILIIVSEDKEKLKRQVAITDEYINSAGFVTVSNNYNPGDMWFCSLPAMFRTGYNHSFTGTDDMAQNLII